MIAPFLEHEFMRNALFALVFIALMFAPLSLFMVSRRMSMMGDAMSHALLPGVVIASLMGFSLVLGGLIAGLFVALTTPLISRLNKTQDDVAFAFISVLSLALGVGLLPFSGLDLTHVLFGSILTLENIWVLACVALGVISIIFMIYEKLVLDTIDPLFMRVQSRFAWVWSMLFLSLMAVALTFSFQAIGSLLSVGLMLIPHLGARLVVQTARQQMLISGFILISSGYFGLMLSYYYNFLPTPAILLASAMHYALLLIFKGLLKWKKSQSQF
jgi:zinc/manganese transport system permease protein